MYENTNRANATNEIGNRTREVGTHAVASCAHVTMRRKYSMLKRHWIENLYPFSSYVHERI